MAVQILSDLEKWREVAYVPCDDDSGMVQLTTLANLVIVTGSMLVGMPDLTEETASEWLTRLRAWESMGPLMYDGDGKPVKVTMDMLRPFFGTRTNVFPKQTKAQFIRRLGMAVFEAADWQTRKEQRAETAQ